MKIRITEIRIYTYSPDLDSEFYKEHNIKTVQDAAAIDLKSLVEGDVEASELGEGLPEVELRAEIIDE